MRLNGYDFDAKPLTVRELSEAINRLTSKNPYVWDMPVHFLAMEDTDASGYVTHAEIDAFDGTESDPDDPAYRTHVALSLLHKVSP